MFRELVNVLEDFIRFVIAEELAKELQNARIGSREIGAIVSGHPAVLSSIQKPLHNAFDVSTRFQFSLFHFDDQGTVSGRPGRSWRRHRAFNRRFAVLCVDVDGLDFVHAECWLVLKRVVNGISQFVR